MELVVIYSGSKSIRWVVRLMWVRLKVGSWVLEAILGLASVHLRELACWPRWTNRWPLSVVISLGWEGVLQNRGRKISLSLVVVAEEEPGVWFGGGPRNRAMPKGEDAWETDREGELPLSWGILPSYAYMSGKDKLRQCRDKFTDRGQCKLGFRLGTKATKLCG